VSFIYGLICVSIPIKSDGRGNFWYSFIIPAGLVFSATKSTMEFFMVCSKDVDFFV
jgi:hypothetical protein